MATNKKTPSTDGAGSVLSSMSGPSETDPPQSLGSNSDVAHALLKKAAAGQALSAAMQDNPNAAGQ